MKIPHLEKIAEKSAFKLIDNALQIGDAAPARIKEILKNIPQHLVENLMRRLPPIWRAQIYFFLHDQNKNSEENIAWMKTLSTTLEIDPDLELNSPEHIAAFNKTVLDLFAPNWKIPVEDIQDTYINPFEYLDSLISYDVQDIKGLLAQGLFFKLQKIWLKHPVETTAFLQKEELSQVQVYDLKIIQWISERINDDAKKKDFFENAMDIAIYGNNLEVAKWIFLQIDMPDHFYMPDHFLRYLFHEAISSGHPDMIHLIYQKFTKDNRIFILENFNNFKTLCNKAPLETIQWYFKEMNEDLDVLRNEKYLAFREVIIEGKLDVAQWIYEQLLPTERSLALEAHNYDAFFRSARDGKIEAVQWLYQKFTPQQARIALRGEEYKALADASRNGEFLIIQWIWEQLKESEHVLAAKVIFINAFKGGHLEILKWLYSQAENNVDNDIDMHQNFLQINNNDIKTLIEGSSDDKLLVLKWYCEKMEAENLLTLSALLNFKEMSKTALQTSSLDVFDFLLSKVVTKEDRYEVFSHQEFLSFREKAANGDLPTIQKIYALMPEDCRQKALVSRDNNAFQRAIYFDNMDVALWLYDQYSEPAKLSLLNQPFSQRFGFVDTDGYEKNMQKFNVFLEARNRAAQPQATASPVMLSQAPEKDYVNNGRIDNPKEQFKK